jgi:hypothetical protein
LNICVGLLEWLVVLETWEEAVQATRWANTLRLSPTPAINNELVQPAVAPQSQSSYLFDGTVTQGHHGQNPLFQQGGGAGRIHNSSSGVVPPPLHGTELVELGVGLNNMSSQPFQPNVHVIDWTLAHLYGPQQHNSSRCLATRGLSRLGRVEVVLVLGVSCL